MRSALRTSAALMVAAAPVLVAVPLVLSWRDRLPDRLATHWSTGAAPDTFTGRDGFLDGWAVASLVAVGLGVLLVLAVPRWRRTVVAILGCVAGFLAALGLLVAMPNLDLADPATARIGWEAALPLAVMVGFAALAWWVYGRRDGPVVPAESAPPPHLPRLEAGEPAEYDETQTIWGAVALAFALLGGPAVVLAVVVSPWVGLELLVLAVVLAAVMARPRVRADAERGLVLSSGPFGSLVPIAEVTGAQVVPVDPFNEYGGWGLRYWPKTVALLTRKGQGVDVGRTGRRRVVVTCTDPDRLARVVNSLADQRFAQPVR